MQEITLKDSERTKCEVWTRVMGYYRPIDYFNKGKQQEFKDRMYFKIDQVTEKEEIN